MIALKSVSKKISGISALDSISLDFNPGETHVVVGSSGCGKSTLLRIMIGIVNPDCGEVWIDGVRLTADSQPELAKRMGYVIQEGGLFPHLSCWQNVSLKAYLIGWSEEKIKARVLGLAQMMGLGNSMLRRFPKELSGGQRQRVSLMRALMLDPPILLLDEPLGALDPIVRRSLQNELQTLFDRLEKTVILVTHDLGEAAFFGDTITLLNQGRIVQRGSFQELAHFSASPFVTEFINAQRPVDEMRIFT